MKKKIKILAQENNQVCLLEEMTNASALSEKKPPLVDVKMLKMAIFFKLIVEIKKKTIHILCIYVYVCKNSLKMASELKVIAIVL